ncbi:MAG: 3-octaprenyl-4-hydroxybenzoate carboxy-lyase [Deltaproteobacteria bacterium]|nr:MAG: 3-octaprenyl-4-hydroxybenzoate carboxy-lyase [Deltaproteobacteria bacterium]
MRRFIVGMTGASGAIIGVRLLEELKKDPEIETHLVLSDGAKMNIALETPLTVEEVKALADICYPIEDIAASIASGSFLVEGMAVVPCSIKALSAIANSYNANLLTRAADVTVKEGRPLILSPRETPLHRGHLKLMFEASEIGARIIPPMMTFYHRPKSVEEMVDHTVGRLLDALKVEHNLFKRWEGS